MQKSKVKKKREFGLHLSVEATIQKLDKAAIKFIVKVMYQLEKKNVFEAINQKQLSLQEQKKLMGKRIILKEKFKADGGFENLNHAWLHSDSSTWCVAAGLRVLLQLPLRFYSWRGLQQGSDDLWLRQTSLEPTSTMS